MKAAEFCSDDVCSFVLVQHATKLGVVDATSLVFVEFVEGRFDLFSGHVGTNLFEFGTTHKTITISV